MRFTRLPTSAIAAIGFVGFLGAAFLVVYLMRQVPSPEESCTRQCSESKRSGRMVPVYPPAQTAGMRGPGPMRCECY